jgi:hypothetical protein
LFAECQQCLVRLGLPGFFAQLIGRLSADLQDPFGDNVEAIVGLYRALAAAYLNPALRADFASPEIVGHLRTRRESVPNRVVDAQWHAIASYAADDDVSFLQEAVRIVLAARDVIHPYFVSALAYLRSLVPKLGEWVTRAFIARLVELFVDFPNHGFFQASLCDFFSACLRNPDVSIHVAAQFGPMLMAAGESRVSGIMHYFALEMVGALCRAAREDSDLWAVIIQLPGLREFVENIYLPWRRSSEGHYGGKIKKRWRRARQAR